MINLKSQQIWQFVAALREMKATNTGKKAWMRPSVHILSITRDTFSGSGGGAEKAGKAGPPKKK